MSTTHDKADIIPAPRTLEEATYLAAEYRTLANAIAEIDANAIAAIADFRSARERAVAPLAYSLRQRYEALRAWWSVAGAAQVEPGQMSLALAGTRVGQRTTPPCLGLCGADEAERVELLLFAGWDELVKVEQRLNQPAILALLGSDLAVQIEALGFEILQHDEFYIDLPEPPAHVAPAANDPGGL